MTPAPGDPNQAILLELALLMNERKSVEDVFASFAERLLAATRFEFTSLVTVEPDPRYARVAGRFPVWEGSLPGGTVLKLAEAPAEWRDAGIEGVEYRPQADDAGIWRRYHERGLRDCWVSNLRLEGTSHGFLTVARRAVTPISTGELDFLRAAARLLAAAVRQDRFLAQAEQEAAQSQLLNELAVLLHAGEPIEALFDRMLAVIGQAISLDHISLTLRAENDRYVLVGARPAAGLPVGEPTPSEQAQADTVFAAPGHMLEFRTDRTEGYWPGLLAAAGIVRAMTAGLSAAGQRLGFVVVGRAANFAFSEADRRFIAGLAVTLSQAEANRRRLEQIAAAAARERVLSELAVLLNAGENVEALFESLPTLLKRAIDCDYLGLVVPTETSGVVRVVGAHPEIVWPAGTILTMAEADLERSQPIRGVVQAATRWVADSPPCAALYANGIQRIAVATRFENNRPAGRLTIGRRLDVPYPPEDVEFIEVLSTLLGQAVVNQQRLQQIETEAARARILNELAVLLNAGEQADALFDRLLSLLERAIEFDFVSLSVATDEPGMLRQVGSRPELLRQRGALVDFETVGMKPIADGPGVVQYRSDRVPGEPDAILSREGIIRVAAIALRYGGAPVGMLAIARRRNLPYVPQDAEFVESVATILGQAVGNQRHVQRIETEAARARVLNELTILLNESEPIEALFDRLLPPLERAIEFDYVGLLVATDEPGMLRQVGSRPELIRPAGTLVDFETAAMAPVADRTGLVQYRTDRVAAASSPALLQAGVMRDAVIALRDGREPVGIFDIARRRNVPYSPEEAGFIETLATILGQAVGNQRHVRRIEAEAARAHVLNELTVLLNAGEPVDALFDRLPVLLERALEFDYVSLLAVSDRPGMLRMVGSWPELVRPAGDEVDAATAGLHQLSSESGVAQYRTDREQSVSSKVMADAGIARAAAAVLRADGEPVGMFSLGRRREARFSPEEVEFIEVVVTILGQAVGNQRRLESATAEAARSRLLNEVALLVNTGEPAQDFFERLRELLLGAVHFDHMTLLVAEDGGEQLRVVGTMRASLFEVGDLLPASAILSEPEAADTRTVYDVRLCDIDSEMSRRGQEKGFARVSWATMRDGPDLVGVFIGGRDADLPLSPWETDLLGLLAMLVGQALANERRLQRAAAEAARSRLLAEMAVLLKAGEPPRRFFDRLSELLQAAISFDYLALLVAESDGRQLRVEGSLRSLVLKAGAVLPVDQVLAGPPPTDGRLVHQHLTSQIGSAIADVSHHAGVARVASGILRDGEDLLGVFILGRASDTPFEPDEMEVLELLATLLGQAMANEQRLRKTLAEAARNKLLSELAVMLNAGEPVETVFHSVVESLRQIVPWDRAALLTMNRSGTALRWVCTIPGDVVPAGEELALSPMVEGLLGQPSARVRISALPIAQADRATAFGGDWMLAAPLRQSGLLLGGYVLARDTDQPFTDEEARFVEFLATLLTHAVANQTRIESAAAEAEEQRVVAAVAAAAATATSPGELVATIIEPLRQLIPRPFLAFGYLEGDEVVYPVPNGPDVRWPIDRYQELAIEEEQIHAHTVPDDLDRLSPLWTYRVVANATTLARSGGEPVGLLLTGSRQEGYTFGRRELRIFRLIAQIIGPAMENARAAERTRKEAEEQRVLAEVATVAAREADAAAVLAGIAAPLSSIVTRPFIAYGHLEDGDSVVWTGRRDAPPRPLTALERVARDRGQFVHSASDLDPDDPAHRYNVSEISITAVRSGGSIVGLLAVSSRDPDYRFREPELLVLQETARIVGPAIEAARAAASVARQRALYDLILTSLTEGVIMLDSDAHVVFANAPGRALVDALDRTSAITTRLDDVATLLPAGLGEVWTRAVTSGEGARGRGQLVINGAERWLDYELVSLRDPHFRLLVVTSDVTDAVLREDADERHRQQMEQAARLAALGELIGGVAHELNNPLTAILGFAEIIAQMPAAESLSEEVSIIQKEALRARDIVRDLLFIARPAPVEQAEVAVAEVVSHIERLRRAAWLKQGVTVTADVGDEGCHVWGNAHQLTQVFLNLVTNAEHAIEGLPRREIGITVARKAEEVEIVVADSGAGMSPETAERVFEPFFTTKQGTGTGLGLSLSYSIIQAHHGQIAVESLPGEGTRFRITLPAYSVPAPAAPVPPPLVETRAARVLVIDDEPSLRRVCQRLVQSMGHECDVAESSAAGLALAASKDFDLVLCDYRLATETAADVIEGLARVAPHLIQRAVIATGATTDHGVLELTGRYGLRLIAKPYGVEELAAIIAEARRRVAAER